MYVHTCTCNSKGHSREEKQNNNILSIFVKGNVRFSVQDGMNLLHVVVFIKTKETTKMSKFDDWTVYVSYNSCIALCQLIHDSLNCFTSEEEKKSLM